MSTPPVLSPFYPTPLAWLKCFPWAVISAARPGMSIGELSQMDQALRGHLREEPDQVRWIPAVGSWEGQREPAWLLAFDSLTPVLVEVLRELQDAFHQDAVLVHNPSRRLVRNPSERRLAHNPFTLDGRTGAFLLGRNGETEFIGDAVRLARPSWTSPAAEAPGYTELQAVVLQEDLGTHSQTWLTWDRLATPTRFEVGQ